MDRAAGARRRGRSAALALFLLAACSPKPQAPAAVALDCSQSFDALKAKVVSQPNLNAAPEEPSEPYRAYSTADGRASYFITEPGAPAHPAILMQQAEAGQMKNTGCAYGDPAAYQELTAYLAGLSAGRK